MTLLALNSTQWALLEDAYGSAKEVSALLSKLEQEDDEAFNELVSRICHQMSVYSSSVAAFPHLVSMAEKVGRSADFQADILCLAGAICESRELEHELARSEHSQAFKQIIPLAKSLSLAALSHASEQNQAIYLLKAIASFSDMPAIARVIEGFSNEEFTLMCPGCSCELYVWPIDGGLSVAAEDPVTVSNTERTLVQPGPSVSSLQQEKYSWIDQQASTTAMLSGMRIKLPYLFGEASCPKCKRTFPLFDHLIEQVA